MFHYCLHFFLLEVEVSNSKVLKNMLEFGIDLALSGEEENIFYASEFALFMQSQKDFDSTMNSETEIEIYNHDEYVICVTIKDGILMIEPKQEEGSFDAVLMVLKFISEQHEEVKERFRKLSTEESSGDNDEESEDDSEWI